MQSRSLIIWLRFAVILIGGCILFFVILGYKTIYSMYDASEYAKQLVAEGKRADYCLKIHTFFPTYPSLEEFRSGCIQVYAETAKDPAACELLMPSDYAISCMGEAAYAIDHAVACDWYSASVLSCADENNTVHRISNCAELPSGTILQDECIIPFAVRDRNLTECNSIHNSGLKSYCIERTKAAIDYPEFRPTYNFASSSSAKSDSIN